MRDFGRPAAVLLLIAAAGCGERGPDAAADEVVVAVDTVAGVPRVLSSGEPGGWTLEPELRLGAEDGGPEQFGRIVALVADGDANVYAADAMASEVRVFAADGSHLRSFGRRGGGPGEFGALAGLAWLDGERLATLDPRNARIGILSREGEWLDSWRHYPISGAPMVVRLFPAGSDGFYARVIDSRFSERLPLQHYTAEGPGEVFATPEPPEGSQGSGVLCHTPDGGITSISIRDAPGFVSTPGPERVHAVSWTDRYRIALVGPQGDTLRVVERLRPPVPFTDDAWEAQSAPYRELRERFPGAKCDPSAPSRPEMRAALRHILFDDEGRMWVEAAAAEGFAWEVFDREGRLVASAPAPERQPDIPPYVRGGRLYQVETDDLDVQHVGVYRLTESPGHGSRS